MSERRSEGLSTADGHPLMTSVLLSRLVLSELRERGVCAEAFVADLGMPPASFRNPLARIPVSDHLRLLDAAVRVLGDDNVGLRAGRRADPGRFSIFGAAMLTFPNPRSALPLIWRVKDFYHDACQLALEERPVESKFFVRNVEDGHRQSGELLIAACVSLGRWMWTDYPLRAVYFAHEAPACTAEHERFFGVPVHFGAGRNGYAFLTSNLDEPYPDAGAQAHWLLREEVLRQIAALDFVGKVRHAIIRGLESGKGGAQWVADDLTLSVRTLHRRLQERGTTFSQLHDAERRARAENYLRSGHRTVAEVAELLGFASSAAFRKAFRRWTGGLPSDPAYRP